jgi:hypothetical protein
MTEFLHQASFGLMIISAIIATVVSVERIIFSSMNLKRAKQLTLSVESQRASIGTLLGKAYFKTSKALKVLRFELH